MRITVVKVLDHFRSSVKSEMCVNQHFGEILKEDDVYLYLRTFHGNLYIEDSIEYSEFEINGIIKSAIISRLDYDLDSLIPTESFSNEKYQIYVEKIRKTINVKD